jgi:hypothetical protein
MEEIKIRNRWGRKTALADIDVYNASMDDLFKTDDPLISTDTGVYTETMGQKVWDSLNNQTVFYNLIGKVAWGPDNGWRIRNVAQTSSKPVAEDGAIPDSDVAAYVEVYSKPRWVVTHGEVSIQAQFLSNTKDGMGNAIGKEQEFSELDHIKEINKEMLLASAVECDTAVSTTAISLYTGMSANFREGDVVAVVDDDSINTCTVSTITSSSDTITGSTTATGDQYAVVSAQSRVGITSLDDIVNVKLAATGTRDLSHAVGWPDVNVWNVDRSAATAGQYQDCAHYGANSGTPRTLTTDLLDAAIRAIRENGGEPDLILTGWDQIDALANAEESKQRLGEGTFTVKRGGESTLQGNKVGFDVATYRNIPVFGDNDVYKLNIDGTEYGSVVYILDTRFFEIAVAQTTQFQDRDDFISAAKLNYDFILYTGLELRCHDIRKQAKIWDLAAP